MTREEYLLTLIIKESSEMQKAICKAIEFGMEDGYNPKADGKGKIVTNKQYIIDKFIDLVGIVDVLSDEAILNISDFEKQVNDKKERVHKSLRRYDEIHKSKQ